MVAPDTLQAWASALQATGFATTLRRTSALYLPIEILHVLGVAALIGAILAFDLRLLGAARDLPMPPLGRHLLRVAGGGLAVALATGLLLLTAHAGELAANPMLRMKLVAVGLGLLNVLAFHAGPGRRVLADAAAARPATARAMAAASIGCWVLAAVLGKLIPTW